MKFNEKLIKLRKQNGLSQEELGYKLNVTRQTVSKWELGQTTPEMDNLVELSKLFNISVDELVTETVEIEKENNTIIEDQPIKEQTTKRKKGKGILIALLIIILVVIILKIVGGFFSYMFGKKSMFYRVLDKTLEQQETAFGEEGFFGRLFNFFDKLLEQQESVLEDLENDKSSFPSVLDKVVEQQQNMLEDFENNKSDILNNFDEVLDTQESMTQNNDFEKRSFNSSFEISAGVRYGASIISKLDDIVTNNKTKERKITVKYKNIETQDEQTIKNIRKEIDKFKEYDLSFDYDEEGYIYKAIIEKF